MIIRHTGWAVLFQHIAFLVFRNHCELLANNNQGQVLLVYRAQILEGPKATSKR